MRKIIFPNIFEAKFSIERFCVKGCFNGYGAIVVDTG